MMLTGADSSGQLTGFKYEMPSECMTAYQLLLLAADAALSLPFDQSAPGIEDARRALNDIVNNPEAYGIPGHWYYVAGVYEGPTYCLGSDQYQQVASAVIVAGAARAVSSAPEPTYGPVPRGKNPIAWTLEGLLALLGLPGWLVPAMGVTAIVGIGTWTYFSFLAPVGKAARTLRLHRNPRRRVRRHRRR